MGREHAVTYMMKPLITKKTSTPAAPIEATSPKCRFPELAAAPSAACTTTTAGAASARRDWIEKMTFTRPPPEATGRAAAPHSLGPYFHNVLGKNAAQRFHEAQWFRDGQQP
jgi:hypothetical protein